MKNEKVPNLDPKLREILIQIKNFEITPGMEISEQGRKMLKFAKAVA